MAAPGVNILSTYKGGSYTTMSGTSMASPLVVGASPVKSQNPSANPAQIKSALQAAGSIPNTVCDGKGHGYFTKDKDSFAEPLLFVGSSSADATSPTVTTKAPLAGATGVAVSSSVTATFSEAVQLYCNWYYVYTQEHIGTVSQER